MIVDNSSSDGFFHVPTRRGPGQRLAGFGRYGNVPVGGDLLTSVVPSSSTGGFTSILTGLLGTAGTIIPSIFGAQTAASQAAAAQAQADAAAAAAAAGRVPAPATDWTKIAIIGGGAVLGIVALSMVLRSNR